MSGYTEGFYYRPRIDKEILAQFNEGLICTTACLKGEVGSFLANGDEAGAKAAAESFLKIFGDKRFFIELQNHPQSDMPDMRKPLADLAAKLGIGTVAANDVHFLNEDDWEAHNALCCISTGKITTDPTRLTYPPSVYLKSSDEMRTMFEGMEEACDNTTAIAERCNVELDLKSRHAPKYKPEDKSTPEDYLTKLVYDGAKRRYGTVTDEITARIERELEVIKGKGFASYFLIVWDFCNYATTKRHTGRGKGQRRRHYRRLLPWPLRC